MKTQTERIIVTPEDFKNLTFDVKVDITNEPKGTCHCGCDCNLECEIHRDQHEEIPKK